MTRSVVSKPPYVLYDGGFDKLNHPYDSIMPLINLTPEISYLPSVESPISSDVVFIKPQGSDTTWIFDTGTCSEAAEFINAVEGKKNIVISHFHPDHILNLLKVKYDKLYVSKYTKKYTRAGEIV